MSEFPISGSGSGVEVDVVSAVCSREEIQSDANTPVNIFSRVVRFAGAWLSRSELESKGLTAAYIKYATRRDGIIADTVVGIHEE
jgi:hypothetical protein